MWSSLFRVFLAACLAASLSGCTASMNITQRVLIWGTGFDLKTDLAYGADPRQKLDIYTPKGAAPKATVVFIYGGSWTSGTKSLYRFLGQAFAARGYQLVVADYRLYPQVRYPAFVEDSAQALAWTKSNIAAHGGDPSKLILMGHSAGAYNVMMLAVDPQWMAPHGLKPGDALGVIAAAGPLSFNPRETASTKDIFATAGDINAARPVKLAASGAAGAPPLFLMHGTADTTVMSHNSQNMTNAVNEQGGRATLKLYEGVSHLGVISCFAWPLRWRAPCLDDADAFIDTLLRAAQPEEG
jgi:acetyl esterase/lipase